MLNNGGCRLGLALIFLKYFSELDWSSIECFKNFSCNLKSFGVVLQAFSFSLFGGEEIHLSIKDNRHAVLVLMVVH